MRVVRLNFSHGSHEYHCNVIQATRRAIKQYHKETGIRRAVAIALDTSGPEIRTGKLATGGDKAELELTKGDKITLTTDKSVENSCTKEKLFVDYSQLPSVVKPGNRIFIDDGMIGVRVKQVSGNDIQCTVLNSGKLGSKKGVNLPGINVDLPSVTEKDKEDFKFAIDQKVDMIFASFIRDGKALIEIRKILGEEGAFIKIIAKVESQEGLINIDEIIKESDGVMVARGDLGIEVFTEDVPLAQKSIIAKCNLAGKPVICATQMLESMTNLPRPTRAEASDVANAIFDGADTVMLSGETAKGKYALDAVLCMARICAKVETVLWYEDLQNDIKRLIRSKLADHISAVTTAVAEAATISQAKAIVVACPCGIVPQMIGHMRPICPIVFLTGSYREGAQSTLCRAVYPLVLPEMTFGCNDIRRIMRSGLKMIVNMKLIEPGKKDTFVIVDALAADKISFRMISFQQPTREQLAQMRRCKKLALVQKCRDEEKKNPCKNIKKDNSKKCKAKAEPKPNKCQKAKSPKDKCKKGTDERKKLLEEEFKKLQAEEAAKEKKDKEDLEKCRKRAQEAKDKEQSRRCKKAAKKKKQKQLANEYKKRVAKKKKKRTAELCMKIRAARKKQKAESSKKIVEAVCKKLAAKKEQDGNKDPKN
ncbi:hypothetical protein KR018_007664 [Drosophila ironensis]|nr:hypothetical protein KR018_007664 [Drosophila ironensis]